MSNETKRLSLSYNEVCEVYEKTLDRYVKNCCTCEKLKAKIEKFIGPAEVKRLKRIVKKNPYVFDEDIIQ